MHQIKDRYSPNCTMIKKLPHESENALEVRNVRLAYRVLARFARETRAQPVVREFYARFMRKFEADHPGQFNLAALGEAGDWDRSRRARAGIEATAAANFVDEDDVQAISPHDCDFESQSPSVSGDEMKPETNEEFQSSEDDDFADNEDRRRGSRQKALCETQNVVTA